MLSRKKTELIMIAVYTTHISNKHLDNFQNDKFIISGKEVFYRYNIIFAS